MKIVQWVFAGLCIFMLCGCSSSKKEGEACERDSQCEGLMACYKEKDGDEFGKCMKAAQARALHGKKKKNR
jgi:hypothetical protein